MEDKYIIQETKRTTIIRGIKLTFDVKIKINKETKEEIWDRDLEVENLKSFQKAYKEIKNKLNRGVER